jgi:hypothetical protein
MVRYLVATVALVMLSGCGHRQTNYVPSAKGMSWAQAAAVVERGFHEDYGPQRAQSVLVTEKAVVLADGSITRGSYAATALPVYGAAVVVGSSNSKTIAAGQHIYFDTLLPALVLKKKMRENRYAVIIRQSPGFTARRVFLRSERSAQDFADALEALRASAPAAVVGSAVPSKEQYKRQLLEKLQAEQPSYEEYTRRMREIEAM